MKRKINPGQLLSLIGNFIIGIGLLLNGFELASVPVFRIIVLIGVLFQIAALILLLTRSGS